MPIGNVRPTDTRSRQSNPVVVQGAFGGGVASALNQLGNSLISAGGDFSAIAQMQIDRQQKKENFDTERDFIRWRGEENRRQEVRVRTAERDGAGLTDNTYASIQASEQKFLETIPERLREQYSVKMEQYRQDNTSAAFQLEYEMGNEAMREDISLLTNHYQSEIYAGRMTFEDAYEEVSGLIESSALHEAEKINALEDTSAFLRFSEYKQEVKFALEDRNYTANLSPGQQRLLNIIGTSEAAGKFNIRYNGHGNPPATFDSFADHPRLYAQRPDGRWSSASGIAQFTASTWDEVQAELNLPDFSPESQIKGMFYLAEKRYNAVRPLGMSYEEAIESDDPAVLLSVKDTLAATWEAFELMDDEKFLKMWGGEGIIEMTGAQPNLWNDPRFKDLSFEDKLKLSKEVDSAVAAQQSAEATQRKQELAALRDQAMMGARFGTLNVSDLPDLMERDIITKASEVEQFEQQVEVFRTETAARGEVVSVLASGNGTLTKPRHERALNEVFSTASAQALADGDANYINGTMMPMINKAGFIPSEISASLLGMAQGTDPNARGSAYAMLAAIHRKNPYALTNSEGFTEDMIANVEFMATSPRFYSTQAEALADLDLYNSPEAQPIIRQRREEAQALLETSGGKASAYTIDNIPNKVFDTVTSWEPELPMNLRQQTILASEFRTAFVKGYEFHGTESGAVEFAKQSLLKDWGVTELGGTKRIMKNAPEKFYPEEAHIDLQIRREIMNQGLPKDTPYELVPLPSTAAQGAAWAADPAKAGHNAAYEIMLYSTDGTPLRMLGEDGRPWTFDGGVETMPDGNTVVKPYPDDIKELFTTEVERRNTEARSAVLTEQISEIQNQLSELGFNNDSQEAQLLRAERDRLVAEQEQANASVEALRANEEMLGNPTTLDTTPINELSIEEAERQILDMFDRDGRLPTLRNPRYRELVSHLAELKRLEAKREREANQ